MKVNVVATCALIASLAACTSVSEVTPMGKDTYMVGAEARGGMFSRTEVTQLAVKRANAFCQEQGKVMSPGHIENTGVRGWTPQDTQFVFECLDATDPGYGRPQMRADPTAVLQVQ